MLQALLAEHPEILAGDVDGDGEGWGWLLVRREAGVGVMEGGGSRWSLDHLFLDADGVPTLVEVKRSSDTRARREVVAQMLDYAANAASFWRVELLEAWLLEECRARATDVDTALRDVLGISDAPAFWATVQTNLAADRIRLVFVADAISPELRSIVEFLNRQMTETEVLAIEVKQYVDASGGRQTIIPRVLGTTEAARAAKSALGRTFRSTFDFSAARPGFHELLDRLDTLAGELGLIVTSARTGRNYRPPETEAGASQPTGIGVYVTGRGAELNLQVLRERGSTHVTDDLLERLRALTGLSITASSWPAVPCEVAVRHWEQIRSEVLEPYFRARAELPSIGPSARPGS